MKSLLLCLFALMINARFAQLAQAADKPNIVFFFSDDQNAETIGALNNPHIKTPNIDKLYERGFHFNRTFCMGSHHGAVCAPSRAMLMSARMLFRAPENLKDVTLMPTILAEAGYETFGTGKWHNGPDSFARAFKHGSNIFFGGMGTQDKLPICDMKPDHTFTPKQALTKFSSESFADAAVSFIDGHKAKNPFFVYVSFTQPHDPRTSPPPYDTMYDPAKLPLPKSYLPVHPFDNGDMTLRDEKLLPWPRTKEAVQQATADYYGCITFMDAQIGRVIAAVEKAGLLDNTLIVFASDHGLALGRHGLLGKQSLYDHSMRAPLVFAGPGVPKGKSDALNYLLDIFPTLFELADVQKPKDNDGKSLAPIIKGTDKDGGRGALLLAYRDVQRAYRSGSWKLIVYPRINKVQLFNLENDPDEMNDLSDKPDQAERKELYLRRIELMQQHYGDPAPLRTERPAKAEFKPPGQK